MKTLILISLCCLVMPIYAYSYDNTDRDSSDYQNRVQQEQQNVQQQRQDTRNNVDTKYNDDHSGDNSYKYNDQ